MNYIFEFTDDVNKQSIIDENVDKILIEVQHYLTGNYLVFSDEKPLVMQLQDLNNTSNMILLKQEGII